MQDLVRLGALSEEAAAFLKKLVVSGYNIFISGGTGSGKTTLLNALSQFIPGEERIITIEDNAELQILGAPNLVRLEARNPNMEGAGEITIRQLIRTALRMRPDRIIVGEVRGAETIDMIQAMSTGHRGSLSTGHSDSPRDMLRRLETMVLMGMDIPLAAIQRQIASAIDIIIHVGRLRDKSRKVLEIVEVLDYADGEIQTGCLYEFQETGTGPGGTVTGEVGEERSALPHGKITFGRISGPMNMCWPSCSTRGISRVIAWLYYESVRGLSCIRAGRLTLSETLGSSSARRKRSGNLPCSFRRRSGLWQRPFMWDIRWKMP